MTAVTHAFSFGPAPELLPRVLPPARPANDATPPPPPSSAARIAQLHTLHHKFLFERARKWTGQDADAWDLVQETFVRAQSALDARVPDAKAARWMLVIMHNTFLDDRRRAAYRRRSRFGEEQLYDLPAPEPANEEEPLWQTLGSEDVQAALGRLGPRLRGVFELRIGRGLSYTEIGAELGIAPSTVGTRLLRARRLLRRYLSCGLGGAAGVEMGG